MHNYVRVDICSEPVVIAASVSLRHNMVADLIRSTGISSTAGAALSIDMPLKARKASNVALSGVSNWQISIFNMQWNIHIYLFINQKSIFIVYFLTLALSNNAFACLTSSPLNKLFAPTTITM